MSKEPLVFSLLALALISSSLILSSGCESYESTTGRNERINSYQNTASQTYDTANQTSGSDEVSFGSLNWTYGGVNGSGATHSGVTISGLSASGMSMSFNYVTDLSAWGASHDDASKALACFFVKNNAGQWVGGKFDWISSSRTSRELDHLTNYEGWTLRDIPNSTDAAFVIITPDGSKRSNIIKTQWQR